MYYCQHRDHSITYQCLQHHSSTYAGLPKLKTSFTHITIILASSCERYRSNQSCSVGGGNQALSQIMRKAFQGPTHKRL